jgi:serine/threonine protein kinase/Flp pilus assembly protein TadD
MATWNPKANDLFLEALKLRTDEQRRDLLDRVCGEDAALRAEVECLLEASDRAGSFLDRPAVDLGLAATDAHAEESGAGPSREDVGSVIGPYKLLQPIGEGGMGTVYMAEQVAPVRRMVALKVIKAGMDSRQVLARFDAERQVLALMDHPNIARVLDAGATERGRPYFVMELVKGVPITQFCDERRLTPRERLDLFIEVCRAVQHAHQKGVIHRDLKPSNVLVALYDGRPVPKVIDFGVAKATGARLTDATLFTGFGTVVGTPEYMSPEQAMLNQLDVDTRSDIYSLGVLLYELLTGTTPLQHWRVHEAAVLEILRLIREEEPQRPSQRLSSTEELPSIAANRGTEPRRLSILVQGDLDWIVLKALEKDRGRRYESASAFAADLQRYLSDEPVQACPPSARYRIRKFARRNRRVLGTAAAAAFALSVGAGGLLSLLLDRQTRSLRMTGEVTQVLRQADALYDESKLPEALAEARKAKGLLGTGGAPAEVRQQVERRLADLEMAMRLEELRIEWLGFRDPATTYAACARAFREYGIDIDALTQEEAVRRTTASRIKLDLVLALGWWASLLETDPKRKDPARCQRLRELARLSDPDPWRTQARAASRAKDVRALHELVAEADLDRLHVRSLTSLAASLWNVGDAEGAIAFLRRVQRRFPGDYQANSLLGGYLRLCKPPRYYEAVGYCRAALALRPRNAQPCNALALCLNNLGDWEGAAVAAREALRIAPDSDHAHKYLAYALLHQGDIPGALTAIREAIRLRPDSALYRKDLGDVLLENGELDAALEEYRRADRLKPDDAATLSGMGSAHLIRGLAEGDEAPVDEALAAYQEAERLQPELVRTLFGLCTIRHLRGDREAALSALRTFARAHPEAMTEADCYGRLAHHFNSIARLLANARDTGLRNPARAVELAREAVALEAGEPAYWNTLGVARYRAGDWGQAILDLEKSMSLGRGGDATDMLCMAMAHWRLGREPDAVRWYGKALGWIEKNQNPGEEIGLLRIEAAQLLGIEEKPD